MNRYSERNQRMRLYRDRDNAWLLGVCAGLGDYFGVNPGLIRLITVIMALLFFVPTTIVYLLAGLLIPPKSILEDPVDPEIRSYWQHWRRSRANGLESLDEDFDDMEERIRRLERHVTSHRFRLDQEIRNLRK